MDTLQLALAFIVVGLFVFYFADYALGRFGVRDNVRLALATVFAVVVAIFLPLSALRI